MLSSLRKNYLGLFILLFTATIANAQIYYNEFEGGGIAGTTTFTGGAIGDPNLGIAASTWSTDGSFVTFVGTAPSAPTSMALQPGTAPTTTWTLNIPVNTGYSANITALDLDYRSTSTSYDFLTITINGITVFAGNVLTDATFHHLSLTGLTVTGITGAISVVSVMSGGSHGGSSTFRYDNFAVTGLVIPANHAPSFTAGASQSVNVCENGSASINSVLSVDDIDVGQTETWSILTSPAHGTLSGFTATTPSTGGTVLPAGVSYTPAPGYTGTDVFVIKVSDGSAADTITINAAIDPAPPPITGITGICEGATSVLNNTLPGGTWSSNDLTIATIDASVGTFYGVAAGSTTVTYTDGATGCTTTTNVTINPLPAPVIGPAGLCAGSTINLTDLTPGGVWSSTNTAVATISTSGVVSGISAGSATISYTLGICAATSVISVTTLAPVTGSTSICAGAGTQLSDATPGGVWSSGSTSAATVSATGYVTGVASGSATIYYSVGACYSSVLVTIGFPITAITGPDTVCSGSAILLHNATSGGVWTSNNPSVASVSSAGSVTGIAQGSATITYAVGSCSEIHDVFVLPGNAGTIIGKDSLCKGPGHTITLSDAVTGGLWSSSNTSRATVDPITGIVTGVNTGIDTIRYTIINSCGSFKAKKVIYVRTPAKCATGIDDNTTEAAGGIQIFPNPNNGIFIINFESGSSEPAHIIITNIVGQIVEERTIACNHNVEIKLNAAPGIYLVSAATPNNRYVIRVVTN